MALEFDKENFESDLVKLEEEYEKKKEIAFLFGIGMLTLQFVGHNEYGVARLKEFLELAKGRKEYEDFYGKAEALMIGIENESRAHNA